MCTSLFPIGTWVCDLLSLPLSPPSHILQKLKPSGTWNFCLTRLITVGDSELVSPPFLGYHIIPDLALQILHKQCVCGGWGGVGGWGWGLENTWSRPSLCLRLGPGITIKILSGLLLDSELAASCILLSEALIALSQKAAATSMGIPTVICSVKLLTHVLWKLVNILLKQAGTEGKSSTGRFCSFSSNSTAIPFFSKNPSPSFQYS